MDEAETGGEPSGDRPDDPGISQPDRRAGTEAQDLGTRRAEGDSGTGPGDPSTGGADDPAAVENGGPRGLEPTRYGDWERKGIAVDF